MTDAEATFWDAVHRARDARSGPAREAYVFVMGALQFAAEALPAERRADPARRHLSGAELFDAVVRLARREFGVFAPMVFREWGLREPLEIGRIVFDLVEAGQLSARPEDRLEDFAMPVDLMTALSEGMEVGMSRGAAGPRPGAA